MGGGVESKDHPHHTAFALFTNTTFNQAHKGYGIARDGEKNGREKINDERPFAPCGSMYTTVVNKRFTFYNMKKKKNETEVLTNTILTNCWFYSGAAVKKRGVGGIRMM